MDDPASDGRAEILLVEDNPGDVRLTMEALEPFRSRVHVSVVRDGVEAMAYLRGQGQFSGARFPDLILLDLNLPRKDGREVLAEIKSDAALKVIPVVVLTTSSAPEDVLRAYGLHANSYVTKPIDLNEFMAAVQSIGDYWFAVVRLPQNEPPLH